MSLPNILTDRDRAYTGILQEECAEVIQVVSKINRFWLYSKNPYETDGKTNLQMLVDEVGDVLAMIQKLEAAGYFTREQLETRAAYKHEKLKQYHPDLWSVELIQEAFDVFGHFSFAQTAVMVIVGHRHTFQRVSWCIMHLEKWSQMVI